MLYHILFYRMDIDYSPTGREFVTGSYDRTVSSLTLVFSHLRFGLTKNGFLFIDDFSFVGETFPV